MVETPAPSINERPIAKFKSEEHWLVDETARCITELLALAGSPKAAPAFTVTPPAEFSAIYHLEAQLPDSPAKTDLILKTSIWSPDDYLDWTRALLAAWKLSPAHRAEASGDLLTVLTNPTPEVLQQESQRVSAALTHTPLDPGLHEEAALLITSFTMREAAGMFNDSRREFCHATAHLAIARALDPEGKSPVRQIAEAALETLIGRETSALHRLAALDPQASPGLATWIRVLRLRNTDDWRAAEAADTPLEQLELFRARIQRVRNQFALAFIAKAKPVSKNDVRRLILEASLSVGEGHEFATESIPREIASLQNDWKNFHHSALGNSPADLVKAFNEPAGTAVLHDAAGNPSAQVLGWDLWGAQHQRHLASAIRNTNFFFRDSWGVPNYTQMQAVIKSSFAGLTLFPLLEHQLTDRPEDVPDISLRGRALIENHPELVTCGIWKWCRYKTKKVPALDLQPPKVWFHSELLPGTTYDFYMRVDNGVERRKDETWVNELYALAPSNYGICNLRFQKTDDGLTPSQRVKARFGPLLEYQLAAMHQLASAQQQSEPAEYEKTMESICTLDPDKYYSLGYWYRDQGQFEKAAATYRKGMELSDDKVTASNNLDWLIFYLEKTGGKEEATQLARFAGEIYSYGGLEVLAKLHERRGDLASAEDVYKKIEERYDGRGILDHFYYRNPGVNPARAQEVSDALLQQFPEGLKTAKLSDFTDAPTDGASITRADTRAVKYGFHKGDVLVAINGYRTHSRAQYVLAAELNLNSQYDIIVWSGGAYRQIHVDEPDGKVGVWFTDYRKSRGR